MVRSFFRWLLLGLLAGPGISQAMEEAAYVQQAQQSLQAAYAALTTRDLDAAERHFEAARKLAPRAAAPLLGLAEVAKLRNDVEGVAKRLTDAVQTLPESPQVQLALGRFLAVTGRGAEAEVAFRKAKTLDPKLVPVYLDLGELYMSALPSPREAEEAFRTAIRLQKDHAGAHNGLAGALAAQQQFEAAAAEFETAARLAPDNALPLYSLGLMRRSEGKPELALEAFDRALALSPEFAPALLERGEVQSDLGQQTKALADLEAAVRLQPRSAVAQARRGWFLAKTGQLDAGVKALRKAIEVDAKYAPAYRQLAQLLVATPAGRDEAVPLAKKAVELQPTAENLDALGQVHWARNETEAAIEQYRLAEKSSGARPEYLVHLGTALAAKGDRTGAIEALERALASGADFPEAERAREQLRSLKGEPTT